MRAAGKATVVGAVAAALFLAAPATADPGGPPPCGPLGFVCDMVPMMPDLDHDIDLTRQYPSGTIDTEHLPPIDVCAVACI